MLKNPAIIRLINDFLIKIVIDNIFKKGYHSNNMMHYIKYTSRYTEKTKYKNKRYVRH